MREVMKSDPETEEMLETWNDQELDKEEKLSKDIHCPKP